MKRHYKLSEILDERSLSGYNNLLLNTTYSTIILNIMRPILDTDGNPVDTTMYNWVADYFNRGTNNQNTLTAGFYMDLAYASNRLDMVTVKKYESVSDALEGVQEICASILLRECDNLARLYYSLNLSYNPLYNKDATETHTEKVEGMDTHGGGDTVRTAGTTQDATTHSDSGKRNGVGLEPATVTEETQNAPYNDNDYYNTGKVKTDTPVMGTDTSSTNEVDYRNISEYGHTIEKAYEKQETNRSFGNLGVTKSTELLLSEYETRQKVSFWNYLYKLCLDSQFMWGVEL